MHDNIRSPLAKTCSFICHLFDLSSLKPSALHALVAWAGAEVWPRLRRGRICGVRQARFLAMSDSSLWQISYKKCSLSVRGKRRDREEGKNGQSGRQFVQSQHEPTTAQNWHFGECEKSTTFLKIEHHCDRDNLIFKEQFSVISIAWQIVEGEIETLRSSERVGGGAGVGSSWSVEGAQSKSNINLVLNWCRERAGCYQLPLRFPLNVLTLKLQHGMTALKIGCSRNCFVHLLQDL